ncbi:MAG: DUF192 domain-containing protein [Desulfosalsimonas sp.]|uniref:DUF192 domain-containing protein n=1 Tax=Desulfosalsimonas sp. TaxID=3073848 RepID=UPI003970FC2B
MRFPCGFSFPLCAAIPPGAFAHPAWWFILFPREKFLYFYMKNTHVALDIAFINQDFQIVDIRQMHPEDETRIRSAVEAKYALEVNRGFFNRHGITVGDRVEFVLQVPAAKTTPMQ